MDQDGDDEDGLEGEDLVEVVDLVLEAGHPLPQRRRHVGRGGGGAGGGLHLAAQHHAPVPRPPGREQPRQLGRALLLL